MSWPGTGGSVRIAAHEMQVVAGQHHRLARLDGEDLAGVAAHAELERTLHDVVIRNQVSRRAQRWTAVIGRDLGAQAPGRRELGLQKHAAGQVRGSQDVR